MTQKRKWFIVLGTAAFFILYFFFFCQKGIVVHGEFLKRQNTEHAEEYRGIIQRYETGIVIDRVDEYACDIHYTWGDVKRRYRLEIQPSEEWLQEVVIWENDKAVFSGKYNPDKNERIYKLYQDDGMPYIEGVIRVSVNGEEWAEGLELYQIARLYAGDEQIRGNGAYLGAGLILLVFWLVDLCFPKFFFMLRYAMSVNDPEPSDFYLMTQRISWILMPVIGVTVLLMGLVM